MAAPAFSAALARQADGRGYLLVQKDLVTQCRSQNNAFAERLKPHILMKFTPEASNSAFMAAVNRVASSAMQFAKGTLFAGVFALTNKVVPQSI